MKKIIAVSVFILAPVAASGADFANQPPPVIYSSVAAEPVSRWSGFYAGVNAGGAFDDGTASALAPLMGPGISALSAKMHRSGAVGGFQAGYAIQSGEMVYGVEADIDFGAVGGSLDTSGAINGVPVIARLDSRVGKSVTVRGRFGCAFDTVLLYGTGGYATAHHEGKAVAVADGVTVGAGSLKEWVPGWTLGAGGEYAFTREVSLKLEYSYARLTTRVLGQSMSHSLNLLRTGVNYRF